MYIYDRFHVQKLMNEAVDELRVKFRWEMMEQENDMMQLAKETGRLSRSLWESFVGLSTS